MQTLEIRDTADNGINVDDADEYANPEAARFVLFRDLDIHDTGKRPSGVRNEKVENYSKQDLLDLVRSRSYVPVIGRAHLLRNKRASGRPKDLNDALWIESTGEVDPT